MADTGWLTPPSYGQVSSGDKEWSSPQNARAEDGYNASCDVPKNGVSYYLLIYGLILSNYLPPGSVIDGIEVKIKRYAESSAIEDTYVQLLSGTGAIGWNYADTGVGWPTGSLTWSDLYGGPTDTWNTSFDIATDTIGVQVKVENNDSSNARYAYIDSVQIKIYYTAPSGNAIMHGMNF